MRNIMRVESGGGPGNEATVWDCNKNQACTLEAIILGGAKNILGCSSKTYTRVLEGIWVLIH